MAEVMISRRLQALCGMVTPGSRVVDVGCDHGFVSIYLVQRGISPSVLAMDVRTGPLSRAEEHIAAYGLADYISTRLSDGLKEFKDGEAQSLICAGMGGRLMTRILTDSRTKARRLQELILQPQSELQEFRRFLKQEGYELLDENILYEEGKYYFLMKVRYPEEGKTAMENRSQETCEAAGDIILQEKYGKLLLEKRNPVLKAYLEENLQSMERIAGDLEANDKERARNRLAEIREEIGALKQALALFSK